MFKRNNSKKGFTLIELLAVIIILGVILLIALPAVSKYIENSRKNAYINSVKSIVSAISTQVNNLEYPIPRGDEGIIIPFSEAQLEKGSKTKSPYGPYVDGKSYVIVTFVDGVYNYYVVCLDESGFAIPLVNNKELDVSDITTNPDIISQNIYSINEMNGGGVLATSKFSITYLQRIGKVHKVHIDYTIEYCTIVFDSSDGTIEPIESIEFVCGSYLKLAIPELKVAGYEFMGWSTVQNSDTVEFPGGRLIATNGSQRLYPVLKQISS